MFGLPQFSTIPQPFPSIPTSLRVALEVHYFAPKDCFSLCWLRPFELERMDPHELPVIGFAEVNNDLVRKFASIATSAANQLLKERGK